MKRGTTMLCLATTLASVAVAGAQTQRQPQPQPQTQTERQGQRTQQQPTTGMQTVTFVGCIEAGTTTNAFMLNVLEQSGTTTSATTRREPDAAISGQARIGDQEVGITGQAQINRGDQPTTGTAGTNFVGQRVQLIGDARTNLRAHVGHQVEITGTLAPQARGREGQTAAETRVNVRNLRMINQTCAAGATTGTVGAAGSVSQQQTRPQVSVPSTQAQQQTATATTTSTFIGCLERGTAPNTFVLNVIDMPSGSAGAQAQVGATTSRQTGAGVQGTAGANLAGQRIQLMGGTNLAAHAGHMVQITGLVEAQGSSPTGAGPAQAGLMLNVSNFTHLATSCTPTGTQGTTGTSGAPGTRGTTGTTSEQPEVPPQR